MVGGHLVSFTEKILHINQPSVRDSHSHMDLLAHLQYSNYECEVFKTLGCTAFLYQLRKPLLRTSPLRRCSLTQEMPLHSWASLPHTSWICEASLQESYKRVGLSSSSVETHPKGLSWLRLTHGWKRLQIALPLGSERRVTPRRHLSFLLPSPVPASTIPLYPQIPEIKEQWIWLLNWSSERIRAGQGKP